MNTGLQVFLTSPQHHLLMKPLFPLPHSKQAIAGEDGHRQCLPTALRLGIEELVGARITGHRLEACRDSAARREETSTQKELKFFHYLLVFLDSYEHLSLFIPLANSYQQRKPSKHHTLTERQPTCASKARLKVSAPTSYDEILIENTV